MQDDTPEPEAVTEGNGEDQSMETEVNAVRKEKSASSKQNEKLYTEEGMLNAKLKKAEKKRRKKEIQPSTMEHDANADYDFKVDYVRKDSAMDIGEDHDEADGEKKNRFELPSGVELDNE